MPPHQLALIFVGLGVAAGFGVARALSVGAAHDGAGAFSADANPIGFALVLAVKAGFVLFGAAELLFALGVIDDPVPALRALLPSGF